MKEKTLEKLRALLRGYGGSGVPPGTGARNVRDEAERRRGEAGERLRRVVRPVLEDVVAELRAAGHEASLEDRSESADAYPGVALSFAPRPGGVMGLASVLTFRYDPRRGLAVQRDVKPPVTRTHMVTASTDRIGTMKVDGVTVDWVETKTLSFVEAVLKAN
jgi:hypothetical protein